MTGPAHNRLAVLAADIQAAHQDVTAGALAVAEKALAAGRMLLEAKDSLAHGEWAGWLAQQVGISGRTARRYMQLARSGVETATVAEIGIRGSAEKLARTRVPRPPLGQYAEAVFQGETLAMVWRPAEQPERFHVLVLGRVSGQDHSAVATRHPVPDELLSLTVAEAGFPLGSARFSFRPMDRCPALFRDVALAEAA